MQSGKFKRGDLNKIIDDRDHDFFYICCMKGHLDMVQQILKAKHVTNFSKNQTEKAFKAAINCKNGDLVALLIAKSKKIELDMRKVIRKNRLVNEGGDELPWHLEFSCDDGETLIIKMDSKENPRKAEWVPADKFVDQQSGKELRLLS